MLTGCTKVEDTNKQIVLYGAGNALLSASPYIYKVEPMNYINSGFAFSEIKLPGGLSGSTYIWCIAGVAYMSESYTSKKILLNQDCIIQ